MKKILVYLIASIFLLAASPFTLAANAQQGEDQAMTQNKPDKKSKKSKKSSTKKSKKSNKSKKSSKSSKSKKSKKSSEEPSREF